MQYAFASWLYHWIHCFPHQLSDRRNAIEWYRGRRSTIVRHCSRGTRPKQTERPHNYARLSIISSIRGLRSCNSTTIHPQHGWGVEMELLSWHHFRMRHSCYLCDFLPSSHVPSTSRQRQKSMAAVQRAGLRRTCLVLQWHDIVLDWFIVGWHSVSMVQCSRSMYPLDWHCHSFCVWLLW